METRAFAFITATKRRDIASTRLSKNSMFHARLTLPFNRSAVLNAKIYRTYGRAFQIPSSSFSEDQDQFRIHFNIAHINTTHTYLIGRHNPSVRITDIVSHTIYVVCVNFLYKWRDVQFKVDSERQIF